MTTLAVSSASPFSVNWSCVPVRTLVTPMTTGRTTGRPAIRRSTVLRSGLVSNRLLAVNTLITTWSVLYTASFESMLSHAASRSLTAAEKLPAAYLPVPIAARRHVRVHQSRDSGDGGSAGKKQLKARALGATTRGPTHRERKPVFIAPALTYW